MTQGTTCLDLKLKRLAATRKPKPRPKFYEEDRWPNVAIREAHGNPLFNSKYELIFNP